MNYQNDKTMIYFLFIQFFFLLQEDGFEHDFCFYGLQAATPGAKPISVGEAGSPGDGLRSRVEDGDDAGL